ncbi:MAG TPA: MFS transporter [Anaerolineales bacterium]|nr:MFS transporter [Anaerolineales bacterium]
MIRQNPAHQLRAVLSDYAARVRAFQPNARLYLLNVVILGAAMGVFRLLFNFYVLSLGYNEAFVGNLITASSLTALVAALPMGYLADLLGRKNALILSTALLGASTVGMVLWPSQGMLYALNVLSGLAQSLMGVTMAPFMMENSREQERTYLFSFSSGLQMAMASVGNWIGGYLPTWVARAGGLSPTGSQAYGGALLAVGLSVFLGVLPLVWMRLPRLERGERSVFAPLSYAARQPVLLGKLILPMLITSIGAGLIMPFMNVFFRAVHNQPDPVIGSLFAWGSLAMGLGLLIAPPLAERMGKIQLVVITQGLSIPFLILLGFSPVFWVGALSYYVRLALMNMSAPVYQTFVMEQVEPGARATVASLESMAWNFGWAFSPTISGYLQVRYGFGPPFLGTIVLYVISVFLYWAFFWRRRAEALPVLQAGD